MLGKLLKYEIQGSARNILPLFAASLLFSLLIGLYGGISGLSASWVSILLVVVEFILIVALAIMTLVITIQRFYTNLLGSEGYLMFTLPVSTHSLILSKLLAGVMWIIATTLVVSLSVSIMAGAGDVTRIFSYGLRQLRELILANGMHPVLTVLGALATGLLGAANSVLSLYLAMALGQLANERRFLASFAAFVGLQIAGSVIVSTVVGILRKLPPDWFQWLRVWLDALSIASGVNFIMLGMAFVSALNGAVYYFLTHWLLKNKLNMI